MSSRMHARGWAHFLQGLHAPDRLVQRYPTRDTHTAAEEEEFIAGFNAAKRDFIEGSPGAAREALQ